MVSGSLVALDDASADLEVPGLGRMHVDRSSLHRLHRRTEGTDLIYSGPNGLVGWKQEGPKDAWREESGQPLSDQPGATIRADVKLPNRMVVEFEISWKSRPDFLLAIAAGPGEPGLKRAFRFEVFDGELVVDREVDALADLASLGPVFNQGGRIHLLAYVDQTTGKLLVVGPDGRTLAELTVPDLGGKPAGGADPKAGILGAFNALMPSSQTGLVLVNVSGDVRLENIQVGKWDGQGPRQVEPGRSRVHLVDGSITYGQVVRFDAEARAFVVKSDGDEEKKVAVDQIADVFLSAPVVWEPPGRSSLRSRWGPDRWRPAQDRRRSRRGWRPRGPRSGSPAVRPAPIAHVSGRVPRVGREVGSAWNPGSRWGRDSQGRCPESKAKVKMRNRCSHLAT